MTVFDLLERILKAYPGASVDALASFKPVFYARLRAHEGNALEEAATAVFGTFKPTSRQPFPIPADFESYLPAGGLKLPSDGPRFDFKAQRERKRRLLADWRAGQGARAANGIPEIMRALETIAEPLAHLLSFSENPAPLALTRKQVRLAQQRAISLQRRIEHGKPGADPDAWWAQITAVAERWGIQTALEEWQPVKPIAEAA